MSSVVLDTNAFLRFLLNDIPSQTDEVVKLFTKAKSKEVEIFIPQIVIFEIEFALDKYYKLTKDQVIQKLESLLVTPYLKFQDKDIFQDALQLFSAQNLDFVDCFITSMAQSRSAALFTFDKSLQKLTKS